MKNTPLSLMAAPPAAPLSDPAPLPAFVCRTSASSQPARLPSCTACARSARASAATRNQPGATQTQQAGAPCCTARQDRRHEQVRVRVRVRVRGKQGWLAWKVGQTVIPGAEALEAVHGKRVRRHLVLAPRQDPAHLP